MPRFSIVVIAYNVDRYITDCLQSIERQTSTDYEAIVVNDASTDRTKELIAPFASDNPRFRLIDKQENEGAHLARRTGALASTGDYLIFVDGDDRLSPTACEVLGELARTHAVDILKFGRTVVPHTGIDDGEAFRAEHAFNVASAPAQGHEVLPALFSDDRPVRSTWSIIDSVLKGEFARSAFAAMTDERLGRMQDSYETFVLASCAHSMCAVPDYHGLHYNYGAGISGQAMESLDAFERGERGIRDSLTATLAYSQACTHPDAPRCAAWLTHQVHIVLVNEWLRRLTLEDQATAVATVSEDWGRETAARIFADPLIGRCRWLVDNNLDPREDALYPQWSQAFHTLQATESADPETQSKLSELAALEAQLEQHVDQIEEAKREAERRREEEERRQEEAERERRRLFKAGTWQRRLLDRTMPEDGIARQAVRKVATLALRRHG